MNSDVALWSDDPAELDLLAFDAVAATVAAVLLDEALDPIALGLSGAWGSGKTTVLGLVAEALCDVSTDEEKILVIETDPWRYDPAAGAKESLIGEVLAVLADEVEASATEPNVKERARKLARRLSGRVDWAKAVKLTAKTSLALQILSVDQILELVKPAEDNKEGDPAPRGLDAFRSEFDELINSEALDHIRAVAVLVDDLDRCLPPTVVETLEAIRLFLSVPRMSFVIAADEERVADALRERFPIPKATPIDDDEEREEPATLYLHKIVQTTIPVPALSRFDTQAFLLLLQLQQTLPDGALGALIEECGRIRREGGGLDDIAPPNGVDLAEEAAFAGRLTPILYEKLRGNPRRIKRFLNDLRVRQSIAERRGIALQAPIIAKLMVLEKLLPREFTGLLDWLAQGTLRDQLRALEAAAGQPAATKPADGAEAQDGDDGADGRAKGQDKRKPAGAGEAKVTKLRGEAASDGGFSEGTLRWAKLPPALASEDLSPYLYLAAAFAGRALIDEALPERLRDLAANLLSRRDQSAVSDGDLRALPTDEVGLLLAHLGRTVRDQPDKQLTGINSVLRLVEAQPDRADEAADALRMIPADEIKPAAALLFKGSTIPQIRGVLERWRAAATREPVKKALGIALSDSKT